ncbi:MAG: type I polyketide synthase [Syntrophobacteraceae bacterium]
MKKRVAIIGYSFRFPGTDRHRFWEDLLHGRELITQVDPSRWIKDTFYHPDKVHAGTSYTFAAGSIGDISGFDADFFGISPREAALMDPQQRLLLELSWEALEDSGTKPSSLRGSDCGVYIGISNSDYSYRLADDLGAVDSSMATGNTFSVAANRLSYFFDLHGPSMAIDTACSSALVAFHQACRSIVSGETTCAMAGGVSLHLHPYGFVAFSKASMLSREGHCKVFDASADGYVRSEGGGLFILKDYDRAIADGDSILAVVAASASNADGRKTGLTVPSAASQAALLERVYREAGIGAAEIDYLEAHGTGTQVGDPIEARALEESLGKRRPAGQPLLIGSVKSNLGHMEAASGTAGLVKALYCVRKRMIPATISMETPNPNIPFDEWNIQVVTKNRPLKNTGRVIIGVNSFGFGGANAHVILESYELPKRHPRNLPTRALLPVVISAKSGAALKAAAREFSEFLGGQPPEKLYDIACHSVFRRDWHDHRAIACGTSLKSIAQSFKDFADESPDRMAVETGTKLEAASGPAFIYSGNGSFWPGMGKRLLQEVPLFRDAIREVDAIFRQYADFSIEDELAGKNGKWRYDFTEVAQPALFAFQVGLTRMLRSWGITPCATAGHSVGEIAGAWACGALSLEAAVQVIYYRSYFQGKTKGRGQMTAVGAGSAAVQSIVDEMGLSSLVDLSCFNSSRSMTISGPPDQLSRLEAAFKERGIRCKRLDLDYAFHSPVMDPVREGILSALADLRPEASPVPFFSGVTGGRIEGRALDAGYWWHNVRKPVLFEEAINGILSDGVNVFVEIGPHPILKNYINDCLHDAGVTGRVIPTTVRNNDDPGLVWGACCQTMIAGGTVEWEKLFPYQGGFVRLPGYPWQREHHWHGVTPDSPQLLSRRKIHPLLGHRLRQQDLTWENQIDTQLCPTLADHVVGDATVFPGTAFVELALAASLSWNPGELAEIEDLAICSPLLMSGDHSKAIRLSINESDGGFTLKGRDHGSAGPWTLHAVGRILAEPGESLLKQKSPAFPMQSPDFNGDQHSRLTRAAGLNYGPAYQAIRRGWVEDDSVLAVYKIPESIKGELDRYHLHPALLDCAFQLIIQFLKGEMSARYEGVAFVPARFGRIVFRTGKTRPHHAVARLMRRTPHALIADFAIFDNEGVQIAAVHDAHFRSVRLHKSAADHLQLMECRCISKPHPLAVQKASAVSLEEFSGEVKDVLKHSGEGIRHYCEEIDPLLDSLCGRFVHEALQAVAGEGLDLRSAAVDCILAENPQIAPFWKHVLLTAINDGSAEAVEAGWRIVRDDDHEASAREIWEILFHDYPEHFPIIQAVGRIGLHLKSIMEGGPVPALSHTTLGSLLGCISGASLKHDLGKTVAKWVSRETDNLPRGQRFGVLEVGEDSPFLADYLCDALDFDRSDYSFAAASEEAMAEAQRLLEKYPAATVRRIPGGADGYDPRTKNGLLARIAVYTCDFPVMENALEALEYARSQVAPGGSILFIGHHPTRWVDFVFGARQGWWGGPGQGNDGSRQQSVLFWRQQLERMGFSEVSQLDFYPDTASGLYFLFARSTGEQAETPDVPERDPGNWLIVADEDGCSARLAQRLAEQWRRRGDFVVLSPAGDAAEISAAMVRARRNDGRLDGVIHLAGLNSLPAGSEPSACLAVQVDRCATAAAIVHACEATRTDTICWLITADAAVHMLPARDRVVRLAASPAQISDAALWGFGTTLVNESSGCSVHLVDLEDPSAVEINAAALGREFDAPDQEREIVLTASGERFVTRLRIDPSPVDSAGKPQGNEPPMLRLDFESPGQLKNLRWAECSRVEPGDDELEIEVRATGLNFRDFMYTIGLLSDEAVANGFAGPTLGLEFSGVVLKAGSRTEGFAPGDRVMGFGAACFSTRLVTKADCVAHVPPEVSFETAVTIPTAFFTAYYALHYLARLREGEKVLIHGATGGVGIAAIQIAKWCGAEVYATAGAEEKQDFLRLLGVEHIHYSRSLAFAGEILEETGGKGVDVILNSLAGEAINRNLRILRPFGRFLELGKRDFYENTKIGLRPFRNNITYFGIDADQLMSECPELTRKLFAEVMQLFRSGLLHPLPSHSFEADDVQEAFRYMQQARQIGKIAVTYRRGITRFKQAQGGRTRLELPVDASYMVTGGLSGFGLKAAEWLAARGARNLILVSRSGPASGEAREAIARLERDGVTVYARPCDVTDRNALSVLLEDAAAHLPPLKGIVHAAAVISDALIRNMDRGQIRRVLAPKIVGAHNLHELTRSVPLDFFVFFSSATTLFGNPGQGNYVAANAWLESLAELRRFAGLPATCVRWGAINDAGFLARNKEIKEALVSRMGGTAINASVALDHLESLLLADRSGVGVLEFDRKALGRFLPSAVTPKFSDLLQQAGGSEADAVQSEDVRKMLGSLSDAELLEAVGDILRREVGEILRISPEKIEATRSMYDMGLDSLMGVELAAAIESRLGIQLPVMALSESPTIARLAEYLVRQMRGVEGSGDADGDGSVLAQVQQVAAQHGVDVSMEAINSFVEDMHSQQMSRQGSDGSGR